jgi:D-tagatose-1,6-bisphosphate aldolase subunit GatZ/KbaZ
MNSLDRIVIAQKAGEARAITSVCSAHPWVLEASLLYGLAQGTPVLIEATCNQVNQSGGYTGMTPPDFVRFVREIAARLDFPPQNLILGGDHLGPLVWSHEPAASAMEKAKELVRAYALAGFAKIHLDCSMPCADDREQVGLPLPVETVARRAADLAAVAESSCRGAGLPLPRYVIGTEVPPPGGAKVGEYGRNEAALAVTDPADAACTLELTHQAFIDQGLESAWERVVALVVQPGVEFGNATIHEYDRTKAVGLARFIESVPGLVYEAHSTDYQSRSSLRLLVEDHFGILKVGPWLTFAFREAVFALAEIEEILVEDETSHIRQVLEARMLANPANWLNHYGGSPRQQQISRFYSFSDRIRYYWADPQVQVAFKKLLANLGESPLPLSLLSQYLPCQYEKIRAGQLPNRPRLLLLDGVAAVLDDYASACGDDPV